MFRLSHSNNIGIAMKLCIGKAFENVLLGAVIAFVFFVVTSFTPWYPSKVDDINAHTKGESPTNSVPLGSGYGDDRRASVH